MVFVIFFHVLHYSIVQSSAIVYGALTLARVILVQALLGNSMRRYLRPFVHQYFFPSYEWGQPVPVCTCGEPTEQPREVLAKVSAFRQFRHKVISAFRQTETAETF